MHLTCFGNIVLIAILVVLALFLIGLGGAVGSYFESKDRSGLAIMSIGIGAILACMLPIAYTGFRSSVYRLSDDDNWEKEEWMFSFKDNDGVRHCLSFMGGRFFYSGPQSTLDQQYMLYPLVYTSDRDLIGERVGNLPAPITITLHGGEVVPIEARVSFIGHPDDEYELESFRSNETRTLWCFGLYREMTAEDSLYHRMTTVIPPAIYQD